MSPAERVQAWLSLQSARRLKVEDLLDAMGTVCPEVSFGERRQRLLEVLLQLQASQTITLPKAKTGWTSFGRPSLPKSIGIVGLPVAVVPPEPKFSWLPALAFAVNVTHPEKRRKLRIINDYLIKNPVESLSVVPYRERSLRIFGDEKLFDQCSLSHGALWGQLPLACVGAYPPEHPLPREDFPTSQRKCLLIVENLHTFETMVSQNRVFLEYRSIVMGSGNAVLGSAKDVTVAAHLSGSTELEYFGDLDPEGVRIAAALSSAVAPVAGLEVRPALALYARLLAEGVRRKLGQGDAYSMPERSATWLGADLAPRVAAEWASGVWLPQEGLSKNLQA